MLKLIASAGLALVLAPPQYPLDAGVRINHIYMQKHLLGRVSGHGDGVVKDSTGQHAFDFVYDDCTFIHASHGAGWGKGYWTGPQRLTVLTTLIGDTRIQTCAMRTTLR